MLALLLGTAGSSLDAPASSHRPHAKSATREKTGCTTPSTAHSKSPTHKKTNLDIKSQKIPRKLKRGSAPTPKEIDEIPLDNENITFQLILRSIFLFTVFAPIVLTSGLAYISVFFRTYVWYRMITMAITAGGAAFIKWGQWASTRPDMFPESFCALLAELQSNAPTHGFAYTQRLVREQLGQPIEELFDSFPRTPVASGSVRAFYSYMLHSINLTPLHTNPLARRLRRFTRQCTRASRWQ